MRLPAAWTGRSERERRILAAGAGLAALLLFVAFVAIPLERTRARLAREVPELRAAIEGLRNDAAEARRLRALAPAGTGPGSGGGREPGARATAIPLAASCRPRPLPRPRRGPMFGPWLWRFRPAY